MLKTLLEELIDEEPLPWEDFNKVMAYKFLNIVNKVTEKDKRKSAYLDTQAKVLDKIMTSSSAQLVQVYVPVPKYLINNNSQERVF